MAFVAETVVGATAGAVPPAPGYFKRIREICDRHGVLLILDEVMCGMGRTGTLHACEQEGIAPDLMTIAKGLGGGYEPIGAVLLGRHIYESFADGQRLLPARPHLHGPSAGLRRRPRGAGDDPARQSFGQRAHHGRAAAAAARRALRQPSACRRHPRPRPVPGGRAGRGPLDQGAVRSGTQAPCEGQEGGDGARPHGLSDGRHDRRPARRSCAAGAAVHRHGRPDRRDRRPPGQRDRRRAGGA